MQPGYTFLDEQSDYPIGIEYEVSPTGTFIPTNREQSNKLVRLW
jgi:hypothetical protein